MIYKALLQSITSNQNNMLSERASKNVGIARLIRKIFLNLSESKWIPSIYRYNLVRGG